MCKYGATVGISIKNVLFCEIFIKYLSKTLGLEMGSLIMRFPEQKLLVRLGTLGISRHFLLDV